MGWTAVGETAVSRLTALLEKWRHGDRAEGAEAFAALHRMAVDADAYATLQARVAKERLAWLEPRADAAAIRRAMSKRERERSESDGNRA